MASCWAAFCQHVVNTLCGICGREQRSHNVNSITFSILGLQSYLKMDTLLVDKWPRSITKVCKKAVEETHSKRSSNTLVESGGVKDNKRVNILDLNEGI